MHHEEYFKIHYLILLSVTRQTAYDFDTIQDREYELVASTNDDGWLVGGGESGIQSCKLPNPDSAHIEIMRVGTFDRALGGISLEEIRNVMKNKVLIPQMMVTPTKVVENGDRPPELEVRFDLERSTHLSVHQWANW